MTINVTSTRIPIIATAALPVFIVMLGALTAFAADPAKVVVGVLPFTSSGPVFIAAHRGYFRDEGLDVELAFFQAAPPIAVATAFNEVTFGVTALTAAAYNLAAEERLVVVAGQAREKKGYTGNLILVTKTAFEQGFDQLDKLFDKPFGLTQMGSPSHYQVGQLADVHGMALAELDIHAFQTLPNLIAALTSGAVTWALIAPPIATNLLKAGAVVSLGPYSNHGEFQFGAIFVSDETLRDQPEMVRAFLRANAKGLADYTKMMQQPKSEHAQETAEIIARRVYPDLAPEVAAQMVIESMFYVDPLGKVDVDDVRKQVAWYYQNGMLNSIPNPVDFLRLDFLP